MTAPAAADGVPDPGNVYREALLWHWRYLVIGGGGTHGVLMASALCGVCGTPDVFQRWRATRLRGIVGTSIGAVQAVALAAGVDPWVLTAELKRLPWSSVVVPTVSSLAPPVGMSAMPSVRDGDGVRAYIHATLRRHGIDPEQSLSQFAARYGIPVHIAVNVMRQGGCLTTEVWGPHAPQAEFSLCTALCATTAIPGVFPPVVDPWGRLVIDGGVMCNVAAHVFPKDVSLIIRTTGTASPPTLPPPLRADRTQWTSALHSLFHMGQTLMHGFRYAAEETQLHNAPFVLHVWAASSQLDPFDIHATPDTYDAAEQDGLACGSRFVAKFLSLCILHLARQKTTAPAA